MFIDSIDCGITALGCCNTPTCQKLGTSKSFVTVLVLVGIVQGASEKYLTISAKQAAQEHNYSLELLGNSYLFIYFVSFFKIIFI